MTTASPSPVLLLNPYLRVKGASRAIEFYERVFNAKVTLRLDGPSGRIGHAELQLGDNCKIMLSDEWPEYNKFGPGEGSTGMTLHVMVKNCDEVYKKALEAGATTEREPSDQFYGHRAAQFKDPFGHFWGVSHEIENLSNEEILGRWEKMYEDKKE